MISFSPILNKMSLLVFRRCFLQMESCISILITPRFFAILILARRTSATLLVALNLSQNDCSKISLCKDIKKIMTSEPFELDNPSINTYQGDGIKDSIWSCLSTRCQFGVVEDTNACYCYK